MNDQLQEQLHSCHLCNRHCGVNRTQGQIGFCGQTSELYAARAALHPWEEPCISGSRGSGTVFFSGCSMRCVFCQNHDIAIGDKGMLISPQKLVDTFLLLQEKGAHNINLVTPTHFIPQIAGALTNAKNRGLSIPIVYNTGSYDTVSGLKLLDGLIDIYLPDYKYFSPQISLRYANASNYSTCAQEAIAEMYRQVGSPVFSQEAFSDEGEDLSETHLMQKGVIVRHMLLPGLSDDSKKIIRYLWETYRNRIYISVMNQYTPVLSSDKIKQYPELANRIHDSEYENIIDFMISLGMEQVFIQGDSTSQESYIPPFNFEGLLGQ